MLFEDLAICLDIYDLILKYPLTCWNAKGKILFMYVFPNHWKGLDNDNFLLQQRKLKTSTMPSLLSTRTTVERWKRKVGIFIFYFPFPFWLILGRLREDPYGFMYSAFGHCPNRIWPYILKAKKFAEPLFQSKKCVNPGVIFGPFWVILGPFWVLIGPLWVIFGHFQAVFWHFWTNLRKVQIFLRLRWGRGTRF